MGKYLKIKTSGITAISGRALRNLIILLSCSILPCLVLNAGTKGSSAEVKIGKSYIRAEALYENIIHVTVAGRPGFISKSISVERPSALPVPSVSSRSKVTSLVTGQLECRIDKKNGLMAFRDPSTGKTLLQALIPGQLVPAVIQGEPVFSILQKFIIDTAEGLYGLGQHPGGIMNWHNHSQTLIQKNMDVALPFLLSTNNYGILWDNPSHTEFSSRADSMSFWSEVADAIDFYVITGRNADSIIAGYRKLTGQAPMLPLWAYGYWQSKERYKSRREILDIAREYRSRHIPLDVIVQDWQYWGKYGWSSMLWDESKYPDPASMTDSLHRVYHVHYMVSVWPHVQDGCPLAAELDSNRLLFKEKYWNEGRIYDAYSPKARDIYWKHLAKGLFSAGVDGWWLDATEPELNWVSSLADSKKAIVSLGRNSMGTFSRYLNSYPLFTCRGVYENQRKATDSKRVMILTRSAWLGQQRTGAITWSGDIPSSFETLKNQVAAGINFCMSGNPNWNTDIGGFFPSGHGGEYPLGINDMAWRELYIRWFQFGVFCPVFRSHGTGTVREIWRFGDPGSLMYETLLQWDQMRYVLLPYIYSMAWKVHSQGYTLMRGLVMDFPADKKVYNTGGEFMFGPSFLVRPVTRPQYYHSRKDSSEDQDLFRLKYDSVNVYLPAGTAWYDLYLGKRFEGGQDVLTPSPIEVLPVYIREGSILPYGPPVEYSAEKPWDPLELRIYPGRDADFTLYEDENEGYNYEKGMYSLIHFHWNETEKTFTFGKRQGSFPGMLKERTFRVILFSPFIPEGFTSPSVTRREVIYSGSEIKINLK